MKGEKMRTIIDGLRYDTNTATAVAKYESSYHADDFEYYDETLYKTAKGRYFLHGSGNALSPYAVPIGRDGHGSGQRIVPLDNGEARRWLEDKGKTEELEKEFPATIEDA